jgi:hypothetical protein
MHNSHEFGKICSVTQRIISGARLMKHLFGLALLLSSSLFAATISAQAVDTSVCDILAKPASFDGKIVRVKATAVAGFEDFVLKSSDCGLPTNSIWLAYPQGTKAKAGPALFVQLQLAKNNAANPASAERAPLKLEKNKDFKQFDNLLSTPFKAGGMCLGCVRYTVTATFVGRIDGAKDAGVVRDSTGKYVSLSGFGNLNRYTARLVLQSVSDVSPVEIDYSKAAAMTKGDSEREPASSDPVALAHQIAHAFGSGSKAAEQVEQSAAAFGKEGDHNGVFVGFGNPNEVPKDDEVKGKNDSPDGLLFNCTFDMDRLKGEALTRAISHVGTHIADIRDSKTPNPEADLYLLESHAWVTTVLSAVGNGQKTLTIPGGYLVWDEGWPAADRNKMVDEGISKYLGEWESFKKPPQQ